MKRLLQFMNKLNRLLPVLFSACFYNGATAQLKKADIPEYNRPYIHFTPKANWMNDPNGMVYYKGIYHLFYQHHPYSTVWGPMHWGHATSADMVHWQHQAIALYPDSVGTIFSGSAVVDEHNTSQLGIEGRAPLVAIFTQHNHNGEKAGASDFQNQSIAYSNDEGKTWKMYAGNPVLKNPGIADFRDPKVSWYAPLGKWVMALATKDCVTFYTSPDLKQWQKESEFGKEQGAHGGVWECPDLIEMTTAEGKKWVLLVSINPGGPNKGSATQYFVGDFDGHRFTTQDTVTRWLDYGADNYAGVTWANTGQRTLFIGWMSNWLYANEVPATTWRNGATLPRELQLRKVGSNLLLTSMPVPELKMLYLSAVRLNDKLIRHKNASQHYSADIQIPCRIDIEMPVASSFSLKFYNNKNEQVVMGYEKSSNSYFIDRSQSGTTGFQKDFAAKHKAPRLCLEKKLTLSIVLDVNSVEIFADNGHTVMTDLVFPSTSYTHVDVLCNRLPNLLYIPMRSAQQ
jgi:fructan beta-fructosidase